MLELGSRLPAPGVPFGIVCVQLVERISLVYLVNISGDYDDYMCAV